MSKTFAVATAALLALSLGADTRAQVADFYDVNTYRTVYLQFNQANYWTLLTNNYSSQTEIPADLTVDGVVHPNVGVRFRGNTSYTWLPTGSQKKSFNIRTDSFVAGQTLLGYDSLNLNNGFHDPTFLREFMAYYVMRLYGPAPGCNFVKLYINGQYWGVYINVQQPDKDWARQWFRSDTGNRYRGFPTSGGFSNGRTAMTWLGSNVSQYLNAYQAKQGDGVDLMLLCDILNNTPAAQLENTLPVIFSVDSFYRYAAVMNVLTNTDSYLGSGKDHFLYHDDVYGAFHVFPFDLNEALAGNATLSPRYNTTLPTRPAFSKTLPISNWTQRYLAHFRTIAEDTMSWATLGPLATQFHTMIDADVAADTKKIYTYQQFLTNMTQSVTIPNGPFGSSTLPGVQPLITSRATYLSTHADLTGPRPALSQLAHSPASPTPAQSVTVTVQADSVAQSIKLWRRTAGPFAATPMYDDGQHGDGAANDGVFGVILPPLPPGALLDYYVEASAAAGRLTFLPKTAEHNCRTAQVGWPTGSSNVKINEFLASNASVIMDPFGEYEDYVELYNDSSLPTNVGGMHLTDNLTNPTKWMIPVGQTIAPFGTLLIWLDEDGGQGPLHASFKLSAGGEDISLFATDGLTQLDSFVFGPQVTDIATGRLIDGGLPWVTFPVPTPGARNDLNSCGTRAYSAQDWTANTIQLALPGTPSIGTTAVLSASGGPPSGVGLVVFSTLPSHTTIPGTEAAVLIDLGPILPMTIALDPIGSWSLAIPIPSDPSLVNARVYVQLAAIGTGLLEMSNAVEVVICQ